MMRRFLFVICLLFFTQSGICSSDSTRALEHIIALMKKAYVTDRAISFDAKFIVKQLKDSVLISDQVYESKMLMKGNNFKSVVAGRIIDINEDSNHVMINFDNKIILVSEAKDVSKIANNNMNQLLDMLKNTNLKVKYFKEKSIENGQIGFELYFSYDITIFMILNKTTGFVEVLKGVNSSVSDQGNLMEVAYESRYTNFKYINGGCCNLKEYGKFINGKFIPSEIFKDFTIRNK